MSSSCTPLCAFKVRYYSFRSDDAANVSSDGSSFTVNFGNRDPGWSDVRNVQMSAVRATMWWTIPNLQDTSIYLSFSVPSDGGGGHGGPVLYALYDVEVKIPKGLYGYSAINTLIDAALVLKNVPKGTFTLRADYATQKLSFVFKWPGTARLGSSELATVFGFLQPPQSTYAPTDIARQQTVDAGEGAQWTGPGTVYTATIPGWTSTSTLTQSIVAPFHARFDHIQYFNIHSNLPDGGLYGNNGVAQNIIAQVLIDRLVGEQIIYDPSTPIELPTSAFSNGAWPTSGTFTLLDDKFRPCDTNGQAWTITIRLQQVA